MKKIFLSFFALAFSFSESLSLSRAFADGGAIGSSDYSGNINYSEGDSGVNGLDGSGGSGNNISGHEITSVTNGASAGGAGTTSGTSGSGGGAGGMGGGSVFGGISYGGAAGQGLVPATNSSGGSGGNVTDNTIKLSGLTLSGAAGGAGGAGGASSPSLPAGGASGAGGAGGGSVMGGISYGGAAGYSLAMGSLLPGYANGGSGGDIIGNTVVLNNVVLEGENGGGGGSSARLSANGDAGIGGGSVLGGVSYGGAGGLINVNRVSSHTSGGNGGSIIGNSITIIGVTQVGASGGDGGTSAGGSGGAGGMGGGSVLGGLSSGGASGSSPNSVIASSFGGNGGDVKKNTITLFDVVLKGGNGGAGSRGSIGGMGGGSVLGGYSAGGVGGRPSAGSFVDGGRGGDITENSITLTSVNLAGGSGGNGGPGDKTTLAGGGGGAGGMGGGSVFGGASYGGSGGALSVTALSSNGGNGGNVSKNTISLTDVTLTGASGGSGGSVRGGGPGAGGMAGGSIFGGLSYGGAAGPSAKDISASGGKGGDVVDNKVYLSGRSVISGDIYGGYSHGGAAAVGRVAGDGGKVINNTVALEGSDLTIAGSVYGGYSIDGDGTVQNSRAFSGNTLNLNGYRGSLTGIYNFENFNWILPKDVVNNDTLIRITGADKVKLDDTQHTVAMENDGNRLNAGDIVTLVDKAEGTPTLTSKQVKQGHFIIYDANLKTINDALVLSIDGKQDSTPAGRINPTSKAFLEGGAASLAFTNQGADLISDHGINAADSNVKRAQQEGINLTPFVVVNGGSSRYNTGSHVDVRGFNMLFGVATGLELQDRSAITVGIFAERGDGNYDSYNNLSDYGSVHGTGNVRYSGGGALFHMAVAGTAMTKTPSSSKRGHEGLYIDGSVRTGNADMSFDSTDLTDAEGIRGKYSRKSKYYGAHGGIGYVLNFDEKRSLDVYSRYTWTRMDADTVSIGKDKLSFNASESSRLRLGGRYSYAYTQKIKPYVGAAYEREFKGDVSGSAYGMSIEKPSLSGNAGVFEVGVTMNPLAANGALSIDFGVQGYAGEREGTAGTLKAKYELW
ncbi:autotransporter [Pseudomonas protegens]|uniref:autotransporter n=1 Tax=Pseudomonas protegens TaxID=380021 RepID=UPI0038501570